MTELGREAKALLVAAAGADEPTDANRARVRAALGAKLAAATAAGATLASLKGSAAAGSAVPVGWKAVTLVSMALVTAAGIGAAAYVRSAPAVEAAPQATVRAATSGPARRAALVPALAGGVAAPAEPSAAEKPHAMPSRSAMPPRAGGPRASVEAEMGLIGEAREALRSGGAARALTLLDEHAHRYPAGALGEEREAMRVASLCALGRVAEARAAASQFLRAFPDSPHAARVRASCASDPGSTF